MLSSKDYKKLCKQLEGLGFSNYGEFLDSELWKAFRKTLRKKHSFNRCNTCGEKTNQLSLHHKSYKRLLDPDLVCWVCDDCHKRIHQEEITSVTKMTDDLIKEKLGKKKRIESRRIVKASGLPETLHHSLHASGIINKVRGGDTPMTSLEIYYQRKRKKKDYLMIELLEKYETEALSYLRNFNN